MCNSQAAASYNTLVFEAYFCLLTFPQLQKGKTYQKLRNSETWNRWKKKSMGFMLEGSIMRWEVSKVPFKGGNQGDTTSFLESKS